MQGQDPFFSSTQGLLYENPTHNSQLITDSDRNGFVELRYRDQWRSLSDPSFTSFILETGYMPYRSTLDSWTIGASFLNDRSNGGNLNNNLAQVHTAYRRKFAAGFRSYHAVSFGASLGYQRTNLTSQDLWFGRQYDMSNLQIDRTISSGEIFNLESSGFASLSLGVTWAYHINNSTSLSSSLAFHHLNNPSYGFNESQEVLAKRINLDLTFITKLRSNISHGGSLKFVDQNPSRQLTLGYMMLFGMDNSGETKVTTSILTRMINSINGASFESLIFSFGLEKTQWKGSMSYDMNISSLNYFTRGNGALEISLAYYLVRD